MNETKEKRSAADVSLPASLVRKCLELYPEHVELKRAIRYKHLPIIMNILEGGCFLNLDEDDIIKAFRYDRHHKLLEQAKLVRAKRVLYKKFFMFESKYDTKE